MTEKRKNLLFIAIILALAAVLWLAAHHGGTGPAKLEKLPDTGAVGAKGVGILVNHGDTSCRLFFVLGGYAELTIDN